jgi:CelD/BcsL family acetyltransferase involved in cellulose biosynthesis
MMTETLKATQWIFKNKRLKFSLGGFLLCSVRIRTLMLDGFFANLPSDPAAMELPLDSCGPDIQAALVISHPATVKLPRVSFTGSLIRYAPYQYRRFYLDVTGSFEGYCSRFSSRRRNHLRRETKRFMNAGSGQWFREYSKPEEMEEYYRLAREVSSKTYQEHLVDAGLPKTREFLDDLIERAERDAVRGYILFHNGEPVAYEHCPAEGDLLVYERVGYDPQFRSLGPGSVLLYLVIEHLFESRRFTRFDFGPGEFDYKEVFGTGYTQCADIYFFRRTIQNLMLVAAHSALDTGWLRVAALLDKFGLRAKLKRAVRSRYGR